MVSVNKKPFYKFKFNKPLFQNICCKKLFHQHGQSVKPNDFTETNVRIQPMKDYEKSSLAHFEAGFTTGGG